jgi:hypothetical protein
VPPSRSHRRTAYLVSDKVSGRGLNKLLQPSNKPTTSKPNSDPRWTSPLMAGFNPGGRLRRLERRFAVI